MFAILSHHLPVCVAHKSQKSIKWKTVTSVSINSIILEKNSEMEVMGGGESKNINKRKLMGNEKEKKKTKENRWPGKIRRSQSEGYQWWSTEEKIYENK